MKKVDDEVEEEVDDEVVEVDELSAQALIYSQYTTNIMIEELLAPLIQKVLKNEIDIVSVPQISQIILQIIL